MHDNVSTRSHKKQSEAAQLDNLRRKRERDKDNQRRKRQREREYTASLEEKIAHLQQQLTTATTQLGATPVPHQSDGTAPSPPSSNPADLQFQEGSSHDHLGQGASLADRWLAQPRDSLDVDRTCRINPPNTTSIGSIARPNTVKQPQGMQEQQRRSSGATPTSSKIASLLDLRNVDMATWKWSHARPNFAGVSDLFPLPMGPVSDPRSFGDNLTTRWPHDSRSIDGFQREETFASPNSPASTRSSNHNPLQIVVSTSVLADLLQKVEWLRLPQHTYASATSDTGRDLPFASLFASLSQHPDLVASCDEVPKVLDIMFGGSSNFLANAIHDQTGHDPTLPPERFAIGWLLYLYTRWLAAPSEASYSHVPAHFRPTALQLVQPHSPSVDMILWPQMRENIIRHQSKFISAEVFGLLSCTCRIRGGFNRNFTTRINDQDPQIEESFLRKITSLEGWGILERFWDVYPELVEGLDPSIMIKEEQLIPS